MGILLLRSLPEAFSTGLVGSDVLTLRSLAFGLVNLFLIFIVIVMLLDGKRLWSLFLKPFPEEWKARITAC